MLHDGNVDFTLQMGNICFIIGWLEALKHPPYLNPSINPHRVLKLEIKVFFSRTSTYMASTGKFSKWQSLSVSSNKPPSIDKDVRCTADTVMFKGVLWCLGWLYNVQIRHTFTAKKLAVLTCHATMMFIRVVWLIQFTSTWALILTRDVWGRINSGDSVCASMST